MLEAALSVPEDSLQHTSHTEWKKNYPSLQLPLMPGELFLCNGLSETATEVDLVSVLAISWPFTFRPSNIKLALRESRRAAGLAPGHLAALGWCPALSMVFVLPAPL